MNLELNVFSGRVVLVFAACCAGAAFAYDAALGVHATSLLTTNVAAGATGTLAEDVGITERTTILKTGEGTLNVPASAAGLTSLSVQAAEGTLVFENDQPSAKRILDGRKLESRNVRLGVYGFGESFLHDAAHVAELAECRLDFVTGVQGSDSDTLKLLREKGIKTMASGVVSSWGGLDSAGDMATAFPLSRYEQQLAAYTAHTVNPAICSLSLSDEPHASSFDHLGDVVALIDAAAPETPAYVNLYPNYATTEDQITQEKPVSQLGTATYQDYIDLYCQKVPAKYISYDHYPIRDDAAWMMETGIPRMYANYRIVANACRSMDREFWYIAQLNTAPGQTQKTSLDQLRYQAWTAMAHGAVSIAWACWGKGWWTNNVYDNSVRDDDQFNNLKTVNAEIKCVGARYMAFRNVATRFVDFGASYTSDAAQGAFSVVAADDHSPILVGEMTAHEGNAEAIFVVAAGNPTNGVAATHTVRVTAAGAIAAFGPGGPIALTPAGGDTYTFTLRDNDCALVTKDYVDETAGLDELPALSEAVRNKLAFWGSVKDAAHLEMNFGGTLAKWYDVRETNPESPKFIHLETVVTNYSESDTSTGPTIQEGSYVCKYSSETNRQRMAYFGGYGSGVTMAFIDVNGKPYMKRPMELSSVYGFTGGDFGFLFGNCKLTGEHRLWNEGSGLPWASVWGSVAGDTQIWIDGEKVDRGIGTLPKGFHALHTRVNTLPTTENLNIFENALFSIHHNKGNRGGQYVGEVMFFTNRLTYAERGEVQHYMNRKWFGYKPSTVKVALESGAELDVAAAANTVADLQVTGDGRFVKQGDGTLLYRPTTFDSAPTPTVEIAGGAVSANRSIAVALTAGQKVTAVNPANPTAAAAIGTTLTVDAAEAPTTVEKAGLGYAEINSIPAGTKKLNVAGGVLALKPTCAPVRRYEVAIPNGDFSDWGEDTTSGNVYADYGGWSRTGAVGFCHYDRWFKTGGVPFGASVLITAFGYDACPPVEGRCFLQMKVAGCTAKVAGLNIPEAGEYELSMLVTSRQNSYQRSRVKIYLTDSSNKEIYCGTITPETSKVWEQKALRFSVPVAGVYSLHFDHQPWYDGTKPDAAVLFNALHLYRIGDRANVWKIPNGDFENPSGVTTTSDGGRITYIEGTATIPGWEFDDTNTGDYSGHHLMRSGLTDCLTYCESGRRWGSGFNNSLWPLGGLRQALIRRDGGWVKATFTPPAGRWYLKAHAALWGEYSTSSGGPRMNATVTAGGPTTDLGALALPQSWTMQPYVWATPFEADGSTEVTLTVTFNGHTGLRGVHLDDFELVGEYEYPYEIVQNGDFEAPAFADRGYPGLRTGWTGVATKVPNGVDDKGNPATKTLGDNISREYGRDNWAFGTDYGSGNCFMEPYNNGGVGGFYQDVTFPHAGWYRLSYLAKTRADAGDTSSAVEVSLVDVQSGATNRIDIVDHLAKGVYSQQTALFRVDGPVTRRLLFLCVRSGAYPSFDDISIRYVGERVPDVLSSPDEASVKANGLEVSLAAGAYLKLDYPGTNRVSRLVVDGVRQDYGVYSAANCPFLVGSGTLLVQPRKSGGAIWFR